LLQWFAANKDALVAIAALVSPVVAVIGTVVAAIVSYRAVTTGPRIQREIASDQFTLQERTTREQFALTSRQLDLQERIEAAKLLGAADQKWIDDLRGTIADLGGLITERGMIFHGQKVSGNPSFQLDRSVELTHRINPLQIKVSLLVGPGEWELNKAIGEWMAATEYPSQIELGVQVFNLATRIMEQKQADIAARIAAVRRGGGG
jgi:hypothetical protein